MKSLASTLLKQMLIVTQLDKEQQELSSIKLETLNPAETFALLFKQAPAAFLQHQGALMQKHLLVSMIALSLCPRESTVDGVNLYTELKTCFLSELKSIELHKSLDQSIFQATFEKACSLCLEFPKTIDAISNSEDLLGLIVDELEQPGDKYEIKRYFELTQKIFEYDKNRHDKKTQSGEAFVASMLFFPLNENWYNHFLTSVVLICVSTSTNIKKLLISLSATLPQLKEIAHRFQSYCAECRKVLSKYMFFSEYTSQKTALEEWRQLIMGGKDIEGFYKEVASATQSSSPKKEFQREVLIAHGQKLFSQLERVNKPLSERLSYKIVSVNTAEKHFSVEAVAGLGDGNSTMSLSILCKNPRFLNDKFVPKFVKYDAKLQDAPKAEMHKINQYLFISRFELFIPWDEPLPVFYLGLKKRKPALWMIEGDLEGLGNYVYVMLSTLAAFLVEFGYHERATVAIHVNTPQQEMLLATLGFLRDGVERKFIDDFDTDMNNFGAALKQIQSFKYNSTIAVTCPVKIFVLLHTAALPEDCFT